MNITLDPQQTNYDAALKDAAHQQGNQQLPQTAQNVQRTRCECHDCVQARYVMHNQSGLAGFYQK